MGWFLLHVMHHASSSKYTSGIDGDLMLQWYDGELSSDAVG